MLQLLRIPELAQRDRFVRRAVAESRVLTIADEESASVPSQKFSGRTVQLFWSSEKEAKRWAKALTGSDALQHIPLSTFAADILPGLAAEKGSAGTDWVSDPIEAEIDPTDLLLRLKSESVPRLLSDTSANGYVYMVAGANGPCLEATVRRDAEVQALSIFASREAADAELKRIGGQSVTADPVADFVGSTLPWAAERGHLILLEPIAGAGTLDIKPADLLTRFRATGG